MKVCYLGTGAAEGIPALFCKCSYCEGARVRGGKEVRSRAQVLIDGELSVVFPPDAFFHAARSGADFSAIKYLLVTHSHMDHFYAHDFVLRGYKYGRDPASPTLDIFGNREVREVFEECTRRELRQEIAQSIRFHTVTAFQLFTFGGYTAVALPARHSSKEPFVYLLQKDNKRYLHLCDTGLLPQETYDYLASNLSDPCDLITFDCTFLWEEGSGARRHMGLKDNAEVMLRLTECGLISPNTKKVITHFSHNSAPSCESLNRAEKEYGVLAAYDGMEIEI